MTMTADEFWGPTISEYSRAQAIEDGQLVEVHPRLAREAGFKYPVAYTCGVGALLASGKHIDIEDQAEAYVGRLRQLLDRLAGYAAKCGPAVDRMTFVVEIAPDLHDLIAVCGPGDDLAPVITIMLPDED